MKNKLILIIFILIFTLSACTIQDTPQATQAPQSSQQTGYSLEGIDEDSGIFLVQYFGKVVGKSIDHELLVYELLNSDISEPLSETIALEMDLSIIFNYGTEAKLILRDPELGVFTLKYGEESYLLKNHSMCAWMEYVISEEINTSYYRGMVEEIDTANDRFLLIDVVGTKPDTWFNLTDTCVMTLDDIKFGDYVTVFIDGALTEEVPAEGKAFDFIFDRVLEISKK